VLNLVKLTLILEATSVFFFLTYKTNKLQEELELLFPGFYFLTKKSLKKLSFRKTRPRIGKCFRIFQNTDYHDITYQTA